MKLCFSFALDLSPCSCFPCVSFVLLFFVRVLCSCGLVFPFFTVAFGFRLSLSLLLVLVFLLCPLFLCSLFVFFVLVLCPVTLFLLFRFVLFAWFGFHMFLCS